MFVTDRQIEQIPTLKDLNPGQRLEALADAERIYRYVRRNEFIDETDLRAYGERNGLNPDRMNTALAILEATDRLHNIPTEGG